MPLDRVLTAATALKRLLTMGEWLVGDLPPVRRPNRVSHQEIREEFKGWFETSAPVPSGFMQCRAHYAMLDNPDTAWAVRAIEEDKLNRKRRIDWMLKDIDRRLFDAVRPPPVRVGI